MSRRGIEASCRIPRFPALCSVCCPLGVFSRVLPGGPGNTKYFRWEHARLQARTRESPGGTQGMPRTHENPSVCHGNEILRETRRELAGTCGASGGSPREHVGLEAGTRQKLAEMREFARTRGHAGTHSREPAGFKAGNRGIYSDISVEPAGNCGT